LKASFLILYSCILQLKMCKYIDIYKCLFWSITNVKLMMHIIKFAQIFCERYNININNENRFFIVFFVKFFFKLSLRKK